MEKLKPCPFCGQDAHGENRVRILYYNKPGKHYRVICGKCGAAGTSAYIQPWHDSKFVAQGQAVKAWNRRAGSVKHGRWIQVDDTKCRCSECETIALIALYPGGDANFCPNCGAVMDGEREAL